MGEVGRGGGGMFRVVAYREVEGGFGESHMERCPGSCCKVLRRGGEGE